MNKTFNFEKAKKSGYSDEDIEEHFASRTGKKFNIKKAKEAGYSDSEIGEFLSKSVIHPEAHYEKNDKTGEYKRHYGLYSTAKEHPKETLASVPIKGIVRPAEAIAGLHPLNAAIRHSKGEDIIQTPLSDQLEKESGISDLSETSQKDLELLDAALSLYPIERVLKAFPWAAKLLKSSSTIPPTGPSFPKLTRGEHLAAKSVQESETLPSGMTKLRAIESEKPHFALMSSERQKRVIKQMEDEARSLSAKAIEKHAPLAKEIEEGFDFHKMHEQEFGFLKKTMEGSKLEIDISPISKFLKETRNELKGMPKELLPKESQYILKHAISFSKDPLLLGSDLLKLYRNNNRKISALYETAHIKGANREYVKYLEEFNKKIKEAFKNTMPEDSVWMQRFEKANSDYKQYQDTKSVLAMLKGAGEEVNTKSLRQLALNPSKQKKLSLKMGKEGADEVIQVAKDLHLTIDSLKKIPKSKLKAMNGIFPVEGLIPGIGKYFGIKSGINEGVKGARELYGYWLSTPQKRSLYDQMLYAYQTGDEELLKALTQEIPSS